MLESRPHSARVVKLVDTADLKSAAYPRGGVPVRFRSRAPMPSRLRLSADSRRITKEQWGGNHRCSKRLCCAVVDRRQSARRKVRACCMNGFAESNHRLFYEKIG